MIEKKGILLILDGLGDRPVEALGGQTPLEAAYTPVLNSLAAAGLCGFMYPVMPGIPVGTQTGSGLLLGLPPAEIGKLTRGWVQAVGAGVDLKPGDIALRCNFATLEWNDEGVRILDRRAGRITKGTEELVEALQEQSLVDGVDIILRASTEHRVSLVLRGEGLSETISDTDPGSGRKEMGVLPARAMDHTDLAAVRTASLINSFVEASHRVLKNHPVNKKREAAGLSPANGLITRGAGRVEILHNILQHNAVKTAIISGEGTLHGLGRLFGFNVYNKSTFTANTDTDLEGKVACVIEALEDHDLVVLHIKGTDVCAHDCNPAGKKDFIEKIDRHLAPLVHMDLVFGVTSDHSTDSKTGRHSGDPVPSIISSSEGRCDQVTTYGESDCMRGGLGQVSSTAFLCSLLDQMNRMPNLRPGSGEFDLDFYGAI